MIVIRAKDVGISPTTWDAILEGGILATDGAHVIYRVQGRRGGATHREPAVHPGAALAASERNVACQWSAVEGAKHHAEEARDRLR